MEVRRCDSNSSQIASLTALDPSLVRRRWLILSSPAVQLTLTRLPPRSVPPPPIPCAPSAARTARFPPPPPNPAPAEPAEPPLSIWPSLCARGGSSLHATLPSNPGAPPPPLTRELNSVCLLCCRSFELSPAGHRVDRPRLPPPPPFPCEKSNSSQRARKNRTPTCPSSAVPQARRPFDRGSNPSRSCRSHSNPPALARGTASGRTRGRHMAPTHTVCCPGPKGPGQEREVGGEWMGAWARH